MSTERRCEKCGAVLASFGAEALCPKCMLLEAVGLEADRTGQPAAAGPGKGGTAVTTPLTEKVGDRIGRYKLLQPIGEGGMGVVYMAEQEEPVRRRVALKVIKLGMDTRSVIARFEAERQALALMDHPNIAKVLDAGATDTGRPYFVMELVRGTRITDYCDQNHLSTPQRLDLFTQICKAIQHAHQKGIIHRDIKPSNILVTLHDGVPVPKIIDFGIAKATSDQRLTDKTLFTAFEQFLGTPAYMSPEQAELSGLDIDTRSDIYSLGVLLYELLTGQTPFEAKELLAAGLDAMRRTIREKEPPKPSTRLSAMGIADAVDVTNRFRMSPTKLAALVRGDLDWIVMKALEKDRARRYESANGLAMDVQRHLANEPVVARPPSAAYRFQKLVRRNKIAVAATSAVAAALIIGLGVSTWMFVQERTAKREQVRLRQQAEAARRGEAAQRQQAEQARTSEVKQREQAQANEKRAQTEAAKSQHVAQFLKDMLQGVRPSVAVGRDTTLLRDILDQTAERISKDLTNQPDVKAELQNTIGEVYYALGQHTQAEAMQRKALATLEQSLGKGHPEVARAINDLALVLWNEGEGAGAERVQQELLAMGAGLPSDRFADIALVLTNSAGRAQNDLRLTEVEILHRRALAIRRSFWGREHLEVAESQNNLALVLRRQGKLAEAETLDREALATRRKLLSRGHPVIATSLNNLGLVLGDQDKLGEAELRFREALGLRRELLSTADPNVANTVYNLADVLQREGNQAGIQALFREELTNAVQRSPNHPPLPADPLYQILDALLSCQQYGQVDQLINDLLTPAIEGAPQNVSLLRNRAEVFVRRARWKEAATDLGKVIGLDPSNHESWYWLAPLLIQNADLDAYGRHCRRMLKQFGGTNLPFIAERTVKACLLLPGTNADLAAAAEMAQTAVTVGQDHPFLPYYELAKGLAEYRLGHYAIAGDWLRKSLSHPRQSINRTAPAFALLAMTCHQLQRTNEARYALAEADVLDKAWLPKLGGGDFGQNWHDRLIEQILLREAKALIGGGGKNSGVAQAESTPPGNESAIASTSQSMARELEREGKLAEAETAYRELLERSKALFGDENEQVVVSLSRLAFVLQRQNKLAEAESELGKFVDLSERLHNERYVAGGLGNLAEVLRREDKLAQAETTYRKLVASWRKVGEEYELAVSLQGLADVLKTQGKVDEAEKVYREAMACYRPAAEQGHAGAQVNLGFMYDRGEGVTKDAAETVKWFRKAAEQGNADAQYNLGSSYYKGDGVPKDAAEAVKWFRKSAEQGKADAKHNLGVMYAGGEGVGKDLAEALKWFLQAAEQGEAAAQNNLGMMYADGEGVTKDAAEAVKWYRKAAEQGNAVAQCNLGLMYADGQGVAKDAAEAVKWYRKAAEQDDAVAQNALGAMCARGKGVAKDAAEAVKWYRKAAEEGNAVAQNNLGSLYAQGEGVTKDLAEAVKWFRKAAEQNNADAQSNLASMCAEGEGVTKDLAEAVKWFRKAAEQGHANAQSALGAMHARGDGVVKNLAEAVKWFRKSADQGSADGLNGLAWLLATCADAKFRDGPAAVTLAEKAVAATKRKSPDFLDTLAAAYAEAGEFAKAVSVQKEAIALQPDEASKEDLNSRLKLYESNSPYWNRD